MTIISQGRPISAVTAKRKIMKIERRKKKREKFDQRKELREHKKCNRLNRIVFVFSFLLSNYISLFALPLAASLVLSTFSISNHHALLAESNNFQWKKGNVWLYL